MEMIVPALGGRKLFRVNDQMIISPTWLLLSICGLLMATKCRIFLWEEDRNQRFLSRSCTLTTFACLTWLTLLGRWLVLSSHAVVYCPLISFWHNKCPAIPSETTGQSGYEMLSDLTDRLDGDELGTGLTFPFLIQLLMVSSRSALFLSLLGSSVSSFPINSPLW